MCARCCLAVSANFVTDFQRTEELFSAVLLRFLGYIQNVASYSELLFFFFCFIRTVSNDEKCFSLLHVLLLLLMLQGGPKSKPIYQFVDKIARKSSIWLEFFHQILPQRKD